MPFATHWRADIWLYMVLKIVRELGAMSSSSYVSEREIMGKMPVLPCSDCCSCDSGVGVAGWLGVHSRWRGAPNESVRPTDGPGQQRWPGRATDFGLADGKHARATPHGRNRWSYIQELGATVDNAGHRSTGWQIMPDQRSQTKTHESITKQLLAKTKCMKLYVHFPAYMW